MTAALPLVVTMGEPAGIGPEITLKAWAQASVAGLKPFYVIANPRHLAQVAAQASCAVPLVEITAPEEAMAAFERGLPILPLPLAGDVMMGAPGRATAAAVIASIDLAVGQVLQGGAAAVITNPIQKSVLYDAGFHHPGHTEYLGELCRKFTGGPAAVPIMMLAIPGLRVVPLTVHLPLALAAAHLTFDLIVKSGLGVARALANDFGILKPRLAVAAFNPHGGEGGSLGREEIDIIIPAVAALQARGIAAFGPKPADTLFHAAARATYDAALCMYHDQALIPLKALDFERGVNVTLGLPIVRTSPDHGTALDIAGQGKASAASLIAALQMASEIAGVRR